MDGLRLSDMPSPIPCSCLHANDDAVINLDNNDDDGDVLSHSSSELELNFYNQINNTLEVIQV